MNQVIAALEAATKGSRELDAAIARLHGWREVEVSREDGAGNPVDWSGLPPDEDRPRAWAPVPPYTTSLDAALTLVPDGFAWSVQFSERTRGEAWLYPPDNHNDEQFYSRGDTVVLALCIAALHARAALRSQAARDA